MIWYVLAVVSLAFVWVVACLKEGTKLTELLKGVAPVVFILVCLLLLIWAAGI